MKYPDSGGDLSFLSEFLADLFDIPLGYQQEQVTKEKNIRTLPAVNGTKNNEKSKHEALRRVEKTKPKTKTPAPALQSSSEASRKEKSPDSLSKDSSGQSQGRHTAEEKSTSKQRQSTSSRNIGRGPVHGRRSLNEVGGGKTAAEPSRPVSQNRTDSSKKDAVENEKILSGVSDRGKQQEAKVKEQNRVRNDTKFPTKTFSPKVDPSRSTDELSDKTFSMSDKELSKGCDDTNAAEYIKTDFVISSHSEKHDVVPEVVTILKNSFQCTNCTKSQNQDCYFNSEDELQEHINRTHLSLVCNICQEQLQNAGDVKRHKFSKHGIVDDDDVTVINVIPVNKTASSATKRVVNVKSEVNAAGPSPASAPLPLFKIPKVAKKEGSKVATPLTDEDHGFILIPAEKNRTFTDTKKAQDQRITDETASSAPFYNYRKKVESSLLGREQTVRLNGRSVNLNGFLRSEGIGTSVNLADLMVEENESEEIERMFDGLGSGVQRTSRRSAPVVQDWDEIEDIHHSGWTEMKSLTSDDERKKLASRAFGNRVLSDPCSNLSFHGFRSGKRRRYYGTGEEFGSFRLAQGRLEPLTGSKRKREDDEMEPEAEKVKRKKIPFKTFGNYMKSLNFSKCKPSGGGRVTQEQFDKFSDYLTHYKLGLEETENFLNFYRNKQETQLDETQAEEIVDMEKLFTAYHAKFGRGDESFCDWCQKSHFFCL